MICDKAVKLDAIHNVLRVAHGTRIGARIKDLSNAVTLFELDDPKAMEDTLEFSLWAIQGHCLSLKPWQGGMRLEDI